jgi:hypothetical protein
MKFLEGKTPAERNKIIAAAVLGAVAFLALSYTLSGFFFPPTRAGAPSKTPTPSPTVAGSQSAPIAAKPEGDGTSLSDVAWMLVTPVTYAQNAFSGSPGRNVFAFYEQPAPTPYVPTPVPVKTLPPATPTPTPDYDVAFVSPSSVYAGSKSFRLEVAGNRFTQDVRILFNGNELPTNFISDQKLSADIPANLISMQGSAQIMVRNPDGSKHSFPSMVQIQAPPVPNYTYIGLIEKKHRNNDMAMLQDKAGKNEVASYRLNDSVGDRFRLISISGREVILEDRSLGFKHHIPFSDSKGSGGTTGGGSGIVNSPFGRGGQGSSGLTYMPPSGMPNPVPAPPGSEIAPGIPNPNFNNAGPRTVTNSNRGQTKKDYEDDDDGGPQK